RADVELQPRCARGPGGPSGHVSPHQPGRHPRVRGGRNQRQHHGDSRVREPAHHHLRPPRRVPHRVPRILWGGASPDGGEAHRAGAGLVSRWERLPLAHLVVAVAAFGLAAMMAVMQALSRADLQLPARTAQIYYLSVTAHGVLMALVFTTFFIMGFGLVV